MSEKAADDEEEDGEDDDTDSEIFGSDDFSCASSLESETSRVDKIKDDEFSFFSDFARSAANNNDNRRHATRSAPGVEAAAQDCPVIWRPAR